MSTLSVHRQSLLWPRSRWREAGAPRGWREESALPSRHPFRGIPAASRRGSLHAARSSRYSPASSRSSAAIWTLSAAEGSYQRTGRRWTLPYRVAKLVRTSRIPW
ncbi:MAG: hypothetical protein Kow0097_06160 [Candidatus Bipolaricaulota bacterium]